MLEHNGTKVVNAYERYVIETADRTCKAKHYGQVIYKTRYRIPDEEPEDW